MKTWPQVCGLSAQVWALCTRIYPGWREVSFSKLANFPEVSGAGSLSTCPTLTVMTELQELLTYVPNLYTQWKLKQQPGFNIVMQQNCMISRLHTGAVQSWGCINLISRLVHSFWILRMHVQRNLEIARIPRLRGTYVLDSVQPERWRWAVWQWCHLQGMWYHVTMSAVESHGFLPPLPHQWIVFTCESTIPIGAAPIDRVLTNPTNLNYNYCHGSLEVC